MKDNPNFYFDESKMVGVDYCLKEAAKTYDKAHLKFRNYEAEAKEIIDILELDQNSRILDMGAGTGAFVLHAAKCCAQVYAVDVSGSMLDCCREKAEQLDLDNITFALSGFLSYQHIGPKVDAVISVAVLHHLPDFWKQIALNRIAEMIKPGGHLLLQDVVFPSGKNDMDDLLQNWINTITDFAGNDLGEEAMTHIKSEFSTYDWILEGMLRTAGFTVRSISYKEGLMARYICRKD